MKNLMNKLKFCSIIALIILVSFSCTKEEDKIFDSLAFPDEIHFDKFTETQTLQITNSSTKSLMINITLDDYVTNNMGKEQNRIVESNSTLELELVFKRNLITEEFYSCNIHFYIQALDKEVTIPVSAATILPEEISLDCDILDAKYLANDNKIITISTVPENSVRIINPDVGSSESIQLSEKPGYFHVNNELGKVAVSQLNQFSVVDLNTKEVKTTPWNVGPYIICLPKEDFLIARQDNGVDIGIDLTENTLTFDHYTFINQMEIHPHNKNRILASGENAYKFNLAAIDYTSGDMIDDYTTQASENEPEIRGKFWIPKNNKWIFAESMGIYKCSADTNEDLKYHSSFTEGNELNSICYLEKYNIYIAIHRYNPQPWLPDQNYFVVYDASNFSKTARFPVTGFPEEMYDENHKSSEGFFVFTNADESKIYALVVLGTDLIEGKKWKLLTYDTNQLFN
jgi:hypothetical protein